MKTPKYLITVFISLLLLSFGAIASTYVNGEGRFYSKDEDGLSFVKSQLLSSAFNDVLTKEMKSLGLDSQLFWQKYDEKFQEYFTPIEEALKKKFGADESGVVPDNKKEAFDKSLRLKRLTLKARYGRLNRLVKSYSVKTMSRSTQVPNARYMRVRASVNRKELNRAFIKFTSEISDRKFKKLFLSTEFVLNDLLWNDLGVEIEADFTNVVKAHWKKWLEDNLSNRVDEIAFVSESLQKDLEERMKLPEEALTALKTPGQAKVDIAAPAEDPLADSLWLRVQFKVSRISEEALLQRRKFKIEGEFLLVDMDNSRLISYGNFPVEEKEFETKDAHKLSSNLATMVFRLPIANFEEFPKRLANVPRKMNVLILNVEGVGTIVDLFNLNKLLLNRGITRQFNPSIDSYSGKTGRLRLEFQGNLDEVQSILLSLEKEAVGSDKLLSIPKKELPTNLELVRSGNVTTPENKL